jgi:hypothetical protein
MTKEKEDGIMKKIIALVLLIAVLCFAAVPASAAGDEPVIVANPSSPAYPEGAVATYTCEAVGTNLTFTWYLVYEGTTYNLSQNDGSQPWCGHAINSGVTTFGFQSTCFFEGIMPGLSGAELYCVIEDGHYSVQSTSAVIDVSGSVMPPQVKVVGSMEVYTGDLCDLYCSATSNNAGENFSYLWYETATGRLQDIIAVDRGSQTADTLHIDTSAPGTHYYVCMVTDSAGGSAYSAVIPVRISERPAAPGILTAKLPEAAVGKDYYFMLEKSVDDATFYEYDAPGTYDRLEKVGLTLSGEGELFGVPKAAGEYKVILCVSNVAGSVQKEFTLVVKDAKADSGAGSAAVSTSGEDKQSSSAQPDPIPEESVTESASSSRKPTLKPAGTTGASKTKSESKSAPQSERDTDGSTEKTAGIPWWALLPAVLVSAGAGVGAVLLIKRKK